VQFYAANPSALPAQGESSGMRAAVLVVEDEAASRRALTALLSASGYPALGVPTAEDALEILEQGRMPSIVLVDLDLPGMDGLDLIALLRRAVPHVRTILVTATSKERIEYHHRREPFTYLRKPIDFHDLLALIRQTQDRQFH
jgi:CheY-like chemotaxis protein